MMEAGNEENPTPKRRRLSCSSLGGGGDMIPIDRISSLPEAIISHILSLLPTKSAVTTGFLSRNWRLRWTEITAFNFNDKLWPNFEGSAAMDFVNFVNSVFVNYTDSIHKLRLRWQSCNLRQLYLNIWLNGAIARNFRVLDLATMPGHSIAMMPHSDESYEFELPAVLYTCGTLEIMKLRGPFRIKLPHLVRLPKLAVLELICVKLECGESVEKLVSACPVLESFRFERYHQHADLLLCKVSSPCLKCLEIYLYDGCECSSYDLKLVIDTPVLEHLVVHSYMISEITCVQRVMPVNVLKLNSICESNRPFGNGVSGLIQACGAVKVMKLRETVMLALGRGSAPLPATFGRLTKLVVEFTRSHWSNLLDLIDRCINLQVLEMTGYDILDADEAERLFESLGGSYWRPPIRVPGCLSSSLRHVFNLLNGGEDEMAMLKFLLDNGLLIERVTLGSSYFTRFSEAQRLKILNKVSMLSRASTACKFSFRLNGIDDEYSEDW